MKGARMEKIKTNVDIVDLRETEGVTFKELQAGSYFLYEAFCSTPLLCIKMIEPMYIATIVDYVIKEDEWEPLYKFNAVSLKDGVPITVDEDDMITPVDADVLVKEFKGDK